MAYPGGTEIDYNYAVSGTASLDSVISRLDSISESGTTLESYLYMGASTVVEEDHPQSTVNLTYLSNSTTGDAGDAVVGLDRFGRVVDEKWTTGSGTVKDEYKYTYDADGNVLSKTNVAADNASHYEFDENYTYNQLSELTGVSRGTDSSYQSFSMNGLGDIESSTTNGVVQNRSTNDENQVYAINSATPNIAYDNNGNMTTDDQGRTLIWDAWNRLVGVENSSGQLIVTYTYDGLGRLASESTIDPSTFATNTTDFYYSGTQEVEDRTGVTDANGDNLSSNGTVALTHVFSPADGNILLRDNYASGSFSSRIYFTHDMLGSVTAVLNASGGVLQREVFDSYGNAEFLAANFSPQGSDNYGLEFLWQEGWRDQTIQDYLFGARWYSPTAQVWLSWDPDNYVNGLSAYINRVDNPTAYADPSGRAGVIFGLFGPIGGPSYTGLGGPLVKPGEIPLDPGSPQAMTQQLLGLGYAGYLDCKNAEGDKALQEGIKSALEHLHTLTDNLETIGESIKELLKNSDPAIESDPVVKGLPIVNKVVEGVQVAEETAEAPPGDRLKTALICVFDALVSGFIAAAVTAATAEEAGPGAPFIGAAAAAKVGKPSQRIHWFFYEMPDQAAQGLQQAANNQAEAGLPPGATRQERQDQDDLFNRDAVDNPADSTDYSLRPEDYIP